jgi:predicted RNA-binding protein associated with RNAse of E/G family
MTARRESNAQASSHIHPPKVELFDLDAMTNTDPKGIVRTVREYRVESFGLYLARDVVGHRSIQALESWLLPELGLRVTDWFYRPGHEREEHFYIDVVGIDVDASRRCWRTEDHYLDLVVRPGCGVDVLDTDELLDAVLAGLLDPARAHAALATTYQTLDGLARHGYRLDDWLPTVGALPTWSRR